MIIIKMDNSLEDIEKKLGVMSRDAPKVIKNAVNKTARQARQDFVKEGKREYATKPVKFTQAIKVKSHSMSHVVATVLIKGQQSEMMDFKVSHNGVGGGGDVKAKILKSSSMKELNKGNLKAFVAKFKSGHVAVVQRVETGKQPNSSKLGNRYVKKLLASSIPTIMGEKNKIFKSVEPKIKKNLTKDISKHISKILEGK